MKLWNIRPSIMIFRRKKTEFSYQLLLIKNFFTCNWNFFKYVEEVKAFKLVNWDQFQLVKNNETEILINQSLFKILVRPRSSGNFWFKKQS